MKLHEICPHCKKANLELKETCCEDRKKGWEIIKKCPKCGFKEYFLRHIQ